MIMRRTTRITIGEEEEEEFEEEYVRINTNWNENLHWRSVQY
jgi:hypothetical protein